MPKTAHILASLQPAMLTLVDDFCASYIATRQGITIDQARAAIDTDPAIGASHKRKMARMAFLLSGPGGFSLTQAQGNAKPVAPAAPGVDVAALLAGIASKPQQPDAN